MEFKVQPAAMKGSEVPLDERAATHRFVEAVELKLAEVQGAYSQLVLVVMPPERANASLLPELAARLNCRCVNINLELSERLLELTERQRSVRAPLLMAEIVEQDSNPHTVLDNLEILFDTSLSTDPLRLLLGLSRNRTVVAAWHGVVQNDRLVYAEPGHPEYRSYPLKDLLIVHPEEWLLT